MATLTVNPSHLAHIEDLLGRPLTKDELPEVASADDLSEAQHEIVRQRTAC